MMVSIIFANIIVLIFAFIGLISIIVGIVKLVSFIISEYKQFNNYRKAMHESKYIVQTGLGRHIFDIYDSSLFKVTDEKFQSFFEKIEWLKDNISGKISFDTGNSTTLKLYISDNDDAEKFEARWVIVKK